MRVRPSRIQSGRPGRPELADLLGWLERQALPARGGSLRGNLGSLDDWHWRVTETHGLFDCVERSLDVVWTRVESNARALAGSRTKRASAYWSCCASGGANQKSEG